MYGVFCRCSGVDGSSGFGFELTLRLKQEMDETAPPTWPAALMQALARYVFQSGKLAIPLEQYSPGLTHLSPVCGPGPSVVLCVHYQ